MAKIIPVIAVALTSTVRAQVPLAPDGSATARSSSGQFTVYARPFAGVRRFASTNEEFLSLEPALLVVSCERLKQLVWRQFGESPTAQWRGRVFLRLRPARGIDDMIAIASERLPSGWTYQVDLPDTVDRSRFIRAMVQVLLMEMANRGAGSHPAEIPSWLPEGITQELLASESGEYILPPPSRKENSMLVSRLNRSARRRNPLAHAKEVLDARRALTFEQLSWPAPEQWYGEAGDVYGCSAQLFVDQLLRLNNGPACLRTMLDQLPRCYNWQFAFLAGFAPHFQRALDVEKWWALQLTQFTGHELTQTWNAEESWRKLDDILRSPVEVRAQASEMPLRLDVSLQTILREWDAAHQAQVLPGKLHGLDASRLRMAPELIALLDDYRQVLGAYVEKRNARLSPLFAWLRHRRAPGPDRLTEETIHLLDLLDARRAELKPVAPTPIAAASTTEEVR